MYLPAIEHTPCKNCVEYTCSSCKQLYYVHCISSYEDFRVLGSQPLHWDIEFPGEAGVMGRAHQLLSWGIKFQRDVGV